MWFTSRVMCRESIAAVLLFFSVFMPLSAEATGRVALLVGVGTYTHVNKLEGPANDVEAMRGVLVRRWGFAERDIVTLVDAQATKSAVMAQLRALEGRTKSGDEVFIYFSGHGTSAASSLDNHPLPHGTGAFLPVDFNPKGANPIDGLIVGRTDLRPAFLALERAGLRVWFITDSCFSGNLARSLYQQRPRLTPRMIALPRADDEGRHAVDIARTSVAPPEPYPYREVISVTASAEGEVAQDISAPLLPTFPTLSGKPHGAFTDAMLRVLDGNLPADANGDGQLDLAEIQAAVSGFMASRAYGHAPQRMPSVAQDAGNLGARVFFARASGAAAALPRAAPGPLQVASFDDSPTGPLATLFEQVRSVPFAASAPRATADVLLSIEQGQIVVMTPGLDILKRIPAGDTAAAARKVEQLAWTKRLWHLAEQNRRGVLPWSYEPDQRGGNFPVGCTVRFAARPDREAWLLMLNVDSDGKVSVLYPGSGRPAELTALKAGELKLIPDNEPIKVMEPQGIDIQIALAFDQRPSQLARLAGLAGLAPSDQRLRAVFDMLESSRGRFTAAKSDLRTLPPSKSGECI